MTSIATSVHERAWDTMLTKLDMPTGREWRPYVLRLSVATLVHNRGTETWNLEGFTGHRAAIQTEVYAIGAFPSVSTLNDIIAEIETLAPGTLHRNDTGASQSRSIIGGTEM